MAIITKMHPSFYYGRQQAHRPAYVLEFNGVTVFQSESLSSVFFVWIVVVFVGYRFQALRGVGGQNAREKRLPEADPEKLKPLIDALPNVNLGGWDRPFRDGGPMLRNLL